MAVKQALKACRSKQVVTLAESFAKAEASCRSAIWFVKEMAHVRSIARGSRGFLSSGLPEVPAFCNFGALGRQPKHGLGFSFQFRGSALELFGALVRTSALVL